MATDIHPSREIPRMSTLKLGEGGNRVRLRTCPMILLKKLEGLSIRGGKAHGSPSRQNRNYCLFWLLEEVVDLVVLRHEEISSAPDPAQSLLPVTGKLVQVFLVERVTMDFSKLVARRPL